METSYRSAQTRQDLEQPGIYAKNREFATHRLQESFEPPGVAILVTD